MIFEKEGLAWNDCKLLPLYTFKCVALDGSHLLAIFFGAESINLV